MVADFVKRPQHRKIDLPRVRYLPHPSGTSAQVETWSTSCFNAWLTLQYGEQVLLNVKKRKNSQRYKVDPVVIFEDTSLTIITEHVEQTVKLRKE